MTKRCRHEFEIKQHYPDEMMCKKCGDWRDIQKCMLLSPKKAMNLPLDVRREVLKRQVEKFNKELPDYYTEHVGEWKPRLQELESEHIRKMWEAGEGMIRNPIKRGDI